uniref:NACHT LRR and PYD domain-containing protein n=1 Tax=Amphilophus citrinellus TaxID=61819 RepID=A0A3Q0S935_AMPCI
MYIHFLNLSAEKSINLFHCLNELNYRSLVSKIEHSLSSGSLSKHKLTTVQWSALAFILLSSEEVLEEFDLKKYGASDEALLWLESVVKASKKALLNLCNLSVRSCEVLSSVLSSPSSKLRELDLSNNNIRDSGIKSLSVGLKAPHCRLKILRLSGCMIREEGCVSLATALISNPSHLRELDLSKNELQDSGIKSLSVGLETPHCRLEILRSVKSFDLILDHLNFSLYLLLSGCMIREEGCASLTTALRSNPTHLRELDLSENELQDLGVKSLSVGLEMPHCRLEILRLSGCMITEDGCASLATALSSNQSHLKELDLRYNYPGDSGVKLLTTQVKASHILRYEKKAAFTSLSWTG